MVQRKTCGLSAPIRLIDHIFYNFFNFSNFFNFFNFSNFSNSVNYTSENATSIMWVKLF